MTEEEWRVVPGWPYSVSNLGNVRNNRTGKVLLPEVGKRGYLRVTFSAGNKRARIFVHKLVCVAFNGNVPFTGSQVRHRDGITNNNVSSNLLWGSRHENEQDKREHGTYQEGERNPIAKLTDYNVRRIRELHEADLQRRLARGFKRVSNGTIPSIATQFGVSEAAIKLIIQRINWSHVQ